MLLSAIMDKMARSEPVTKQFNANLQVELEHLKNVLYGFEKPLMEENGGKPADSVDLFTESYWTSQRRELLQWFSDRAPSFVEGYKSAVCLLHSPCFPARIHLICHLVRDIYRKLPITLGAAPLPRPGEVFPGMVKQLYTLWTAPSLSSQGSGSADVSATSSMHFYDPEIPAADDTDVFVSRKIFIHLEKIINKCGQLKNQPSVGKQLVIALYRSLDRQQEEFIPPWVIESFDNEYDFFVSRAHLVESMDRVPN
ncbi:MAG: hypothetical protein IH831_01070, partial [Planctomycetes bacterium]|nr:hypothetical protein [Planctomycetota bacterium]